MNSVLYASMDVLDFVECNMPCICEDVSMSVNSHNCDDMLLESLGVVDIPNDKLLKKKAKKFQKNLSELFGENDDLIAKLNESNKLIEKYKKLAENSLEKLKEFECLNMDLDAKLVLSNKLIDELKCENESLKMHAKCLIAEPIVKWMIIFVAIMLWYLILCLVCVLPHRTNRCTVLHSKEIKKWRERPLSQNPCLGLNLRIWMDLSLFLLATIQCDQSY